MDPASMREHYTRDGIDEGALAPDPVSQFREWWQAWTATEPYDANAVVVATIDPDGWPSSRAVLLKGVDERGFVFYTNYTSAKGQAIEATGRVSLTFVWREVERQVRVVGDAERLSEAESDEYFASRPRGAQVGAWASRQSEVISDRSVLDGWVQDAEARFGDEREVPRPSQWGGYLVRPRSVEFWQGRPERLHDRLRYRRDGDQWMVERLSP